MRIGSTHRVANSHSRPLVYDELRLRLDRQHDGSYRVLAGTHSAEAAGCFELPFTPLEVENFLLRVNRPGNLRGAGAAVVDDARHFGGRLFRALFREQVGDLYRDAVADARRRGAGVRISLCLSGAPELIDVPWEYLFDDPGFLAMSAVTPVVRYLDRPRAHRPLLVEPPLRLLAIVSSPADYEQLDVERERHSLERSLGSLTAAGAVELQWLEQPTPAALLRALQTDTFHALHYIGHGAFDRSAERGVLLFEDDSGWARPVSGDKLGMILHDFSSLRLAILNACEGARTAPGDPFSGVAGALVQHDIPAVVAMQFEISDEAAIGFARGFYQALETGYPVDASLAAARLAMLADRSDDIEWGTPVLFMRVPDGRIFDLGHEPGSELPIQRPTGPSRGPSRESTVRPEGWSTDTRAFAAARGHKRGAASAGTLARSEAPRGSLAAAAGCDHRHAGEVINEMLAALCDCFNQLRATQLDWAAHELQLSTPERSPSGPAHGQRTTPGSIRNPNSATKASRTVWSYTRPSSASSGWLSSRSTPSS